MTDSIPLIQMENISVEFPGVKALQGVDFRLFPGEVHALMGENGAGKSTLIKALTGVNKLAGGQIYMEDQKVQFDGTASAQEAGISTVYQEVNLLPNLTIGENVMLGHEVRGALGINWKKTNQSAKEALNKLDIDHLDPRSPLSSISIAMQQLVAISRAMVVQAKVLILDEPTSSLDDNEVAGLFSVIRSLRDQGVAILFVSHFLDQVYEISDRMTVLRNGTLVGEYKTADLPRVELISKMIGKEMGAIQAAETRNEDDIPVDRGTPRLNVLGLGRKGMLKATSLDLYPGDIVGFAGLLGSGRTELAKLIYGADKATEGSTEIDGAATKISSPAFALKHNIAYSTENRRDEGIVGDLTVRENVILALQAIRGWARPIPRKEQDAICAKYIKELGIRPTDPEQLVKNLSGGNQQKVLLARWLATNPEVLLLDEPTRGIDIGAKAEIMEIVKQLANAGMSVVFISSELEEVVRLSNRILVMKDRSPLEIIENTAATSVDSIVHIIAGGGEAA